MNFSNHRMGPITLAALFISSTGVLHGEERMPSTKPVTSHNRYFTVTGMPSAEALEIVVWAESVRQRLEGWMGAPVPGDQTYPMVISAQNRTNEVNGRTVSEQLVNEDGHIRQAITMINPDQMDQEDLLEAICGLLLNRWIIVHQSGDERRRQPGKFPDWFVVAVAQNLYPELRERNLRMIEQGEEMDDYKPASTIFHHHHFPPGRWPEKARAGLIGSWMAEVFTPNRMISEAAGLISRGQTMDAAHMAGVLGLPDVRAFDISWDVWMAKQSRRIVPGILSSDSRATARILEMRVEDLGIIYPGHLADGRLTAELLISSRTQAWVHKVSQIITWKLQQSGIGKTPELLACTQSFIEFFTHLPPPEKREKRRHQSDRALHKSWASAMEAWNTYLTEEATRKAFLDGYANRPATPSISDPEAFDAMMKKWNED